MNFETLEFEIRTSDMNWDKFWIRLSTKLWLKSSKIVLILENETYAGVMMLIRSIKGWKNQRKNKLVPMDDLSKWCWKINPPWLSLLISNQPSAKTFLFSFSHNYDSHELIIINRGNHSPKVPNGGSLYHGYDSSFSVLVSLVITPITGSLKLYPIRPDVILYISRINVANCFLGLITNMHTVLIFKYTLNFTWNNILIWLNLIASFRFVKNKWICDSRSTQITV